MFSSSNNDRLLIFAKAPVPGRVKTRLAPLLGPNRAAEVYHAFVRDIVARSLARRDIEAILYHDPSEPGPQLAALELPRRPQVGHDLGERLTAAFRDEAAAGAERVVVIGCDSPDLPPGRIAEALAALTEVELVLVPAVDGGYCLIGARGTPTAALQDIDWGSEYVLRQTVEAARRSGIACGLLDGWYDVDRPSDLRTLKTNLDLLHVGHGEDRCPETRRLLATLPELA